MQSSNDHRYFGTHTITIDRRHDRYLPRSYDKPYTTPYREIYIVDNALPSSIDIWRRFKILAERRFDKGVISCPVAQSIEAPIYPGQRPEV